MEYILLFIILPLWFALHFLLFTNRTKSFLQKTLGDWFIKHIFRFVYAIFTITLIVYFIKTISSVEAESLLTLQDNLSNLVFLIIDTIRLICLFLMVESIWTLGMTNVLGLKHLRNLISKPKFSYHLDYIVSPFKVKGLYLRHRQPFLFYMVLFILLERTVTWATIYSFIFLTIYYVLFSKMIETQLEEIYKEDYINYKSKTNLFFPMLKQYQNEHTKK